LGISAQSIYSWRRQDRIDKGPLAGLSSHEHNELMAARRRSAERGRLAGRQESVSLPHLRSKVTWDNGA
jgi:transposase-like protein